MRKKILKFLKSDDGPTAIEYALLVSLIILVCMSAVNLIGMQTVSSLSGSAQKLSTATSS